MARSKKATEPQRHTPQSLAAAVNALMGEGTVTMASDPRWVVTYQPTGVLPMDVLLDGGLPRGRFVEIYGDYSTLKSFVGLSAIASVQADGGVCALVDTEHSFDPAWAASIGIDTGDLILKQPATGEQAVDISEVLIRSGLDLLVWDSVAATLPKAEESKMAVEKQQQARLAAMMSLATRKLTTANSRTSVLWVNQTRTNVGQLFGDPTTVPGGRALPYYASYRVAMKRVKKITTKEKQWVDGEWKEVTKHTGLQIRASVEKSKLNAPYRDIFFTWDLERRCIDEVGFLISQGIEKGLITVKGTMWRIKGSTTSHRGAAAFRAYVEKTPKAKARLRAACRGDAGPLASSRADAPSNDS